MPNPHPPKPIECHKNTALKPEKVNEMIMYFESLLKESTEEIKKQ